MSQGQTHGSHIWQSMRLLVSGYIHNDSGLTRLPPNPLEKSTTVLLHVQIAMSVVDSYFIFSI